MTGLITNGGYDHCDHYRLRCCYCSCWSNYATRIVHAFLTSCNFVGNNVVGEKPLFFAKNQILTKELQRKISRGSRVDNITRFVGNHHVRRSPRTSSLKWYVIRSHDLCNNTPCRRHRWSRLKTMRLIVIIVTITSRSLNSEYCIRVMPSVYRITCTLHACNAAHFCQPNSRSPVLPHRPLIARLTVYYSRSLVDVQSNRIDVITPRRHRHRGLRFFVFVSFFSLTLISLTTPVTNLVP